MVISPLNYTGNKAKSTKELIDIFPQDIDYFVDAFCGSCQVAFNSNAKQIICNDTNRFILDLVQYLYNNNGDKIIADADKIIKEYGFTDSTDSNNKYVEVRHEGLSKYNKAPFNKLKNDYNENPSIEKLFVLIIFGFNHYLRFNNNNLFNVPVGKVDFSKSLRKKTVDFCTEAKKYKATFINGSYLNMDLYKSCTKKSLVYFDPPYLVTTAPYNSYWSEIDDQKLFNLFDFLSEKGIKVAMSNVFLSNGKENLKLIQWSKKYNIHYLSRQYRNANYQKVNKTDSIEVLITNF